MKLNSRIFAYTITLISLVFMQCGCSDNYSTEGVAQTADQVQPLKTGDNVPKLTLKDADGKNYDLNSALSKKPTILIFYRGGWCPFCLNQLGQLLVVETRFHELGYQIIAISPDSPENIKKSLERYYFDFDLLSDSKMMAAKAFGLAYQVDDRTFEQYKKMGMDIEIASGEKHHFLPVPAAYIVNSDGLIEFDYANPDYKIRVDLDSLITTVERTTESR